MAARPSVGKYSFVSSLTSLLLNKDEFAATCTAIEAVIDANAPRTRSSIVFQTEDTVKIVCEEFMYVDPALLRAIRGAIPDNKYQSIEVVKPCAASFHGAEVYDPISVMIQIGTGTTPPLTQPDGGDDDAFPKLQVNNIRDMKIPEGMRSHVLRILNALYSGHGKAAPCPIDHASFSAKHSALIVRDPPTFSLHFLERLYSDFPGIVTGYRFERVVEDARTYFTIYLQQLGAAVGGGYARSKPKKGLLARFNPF